jgi:pimeloyl-ACP methyl ester carboxylesterase
MTKIESHDEIKLGNRARLLAGLPVTERRLQLAGGSTAVLEGGAGPPVVLLHEQGEFAARWMRMLPDLVATHRVIAPDLPGHGASDLIPGRLDVERVLSWLDELIVHTCPSPPVLVGHMLGGAIAARFAVDRPDRLRSLVLVDTFGLRGFRPKPALALALVRYIRRPTEDSFDRLYRQCAVDLDGMRDHMDVRWALFRAYVLDRAATPQLKAALPQLMRAFAIRRIRPAELARIRVPTTLIWGRHDPATSLRAAQAASARYGWQLHVIDNAADDPVLEQPEATLRALRSAFRHDSPRLADKITDAFSADREQT